jgi:hypothetical protein
LYRPPIFQLGISCSVMLCRQFHPGRQNEEILDKVSPQLEERLQMRKFRIGFMCFLATLLVAFVAGCGQETVTLPGVASVTPAQGATGVPINTTVTATFNMAMKPASINASTFILAGPGGAVTGAVTYSGTMAIFIPNAALAYGTTYTATITTGASSPGGAELIGPYVWSFTTVVGTVPSVVINSVTPLPFAANVPITGAGAIISATFSQAMTAASIAATGTFTVEAQGGVVVPGSAVLNSAGTVATFTPTSGTLAYSTTYTVTITTAAKSLSQGISLPGNYVWTFTTITPPPTVTVVPVNGAIGVPISQVLTATFSEAMLCSTLQSPATTFTLAAPGPVNVTGTVACAGSVAIFTPQSNLAYNTLYSAQISTGAQDLAGQPMAAAFPWSFLTSPAPDVPPTVIATSPATVATAPYPVVTVGSSISATFSKAMTANTLNSATFLLVTTTGSTPVNGVITYSAGSATATFAPIGGLAYNTAYTATITTGAEDLAGSGLAANYSWKFTTGNPLTSPPTVTSTNPVTPNLTATPPVPENMDVPVNQVVTATFNEAMNPATIVAANFTLTAQGSLISVPGLVAYSGISNELVFVPSANLLPHTTYNAVITTGVQDLAGQQMALAYPWSFQTGPALDITPPELVTTVPASAAINVPVNQVVSATFTEAMNPLTLTTSTFLLYKGSTASGTPVPATIAYDTVNFIATLTPTNPLAINSFYTAKVTDGATDLAGNPLGSTGPPPDPWTFNTGTTAPQAPFLGPTIAAFGGFSGSAGMTNTGLSTVIHGDSGTTATGYSSYTGFHDNTVLIGGVAECTYTETTANLGLVTGTIYSPLVSTSTFCPLEGTAADIAIADEALAEATTAYTTLQGLPSSGALALEIGSTTIYPGVWKTAGAVNITIGPLTLDAKGDPNAYWVFQIGTILTVGLPATPVDIILINGAKASNIFWVVAGTGVYLEPSGGGTFEGTIITSNFIHVSTAANVNPVTVNGRLISLNASTTLVDTVINVPTP